jgi:hypothetical protein
LAIGVTVLATAIVAAARGGDAEIVAKVGPQAATGDWSALVGVAIQITSAARVLAFGVGISWLFGRELADGTVPGLFGLSVGRGAIATAKLLVYLAWASRKCRCWPTLPRGSRSSRLLSGRFSRRSNRPRRWRCLPLVPLIFGATTIMTWRRLELDK